MPTTTISTISNQAALTCYQNELLALNDEKGYLATIENLAEQGEHQQDAQQYKDKLNAAILAIGNSIQQYNNANIAKAKPRQKTEDKIGTVVKISIGFWWSILLGIGIIIQETVKVAAPILAVFLFPLNFALEGLRSIWSLYQTARDGNAAQRKTVLGTNSVRLLSLIAAATVMTLAITNPFALPVIFIGITGSGLYKTVATILQTKKLIKATKSELDEAQAQIQGFKEINSNDPKVVLKLIRLDAKEKRLQEQFTRLQVKHSELNRELMFNLLGVAAVGLLLAATLFPPAAVVLASTGMLLFASTIIASVLTNVLTSPPVRNAVKELWQAIKSLFGATDSSGRAPAPSNSVTQAPAFATTET